VPLPTAAPTTPTAAPPTPAAAPTSPATSAPAGAPDVLDRAWELSPQVSVRPESFGALLYHFGTRRLSFLKDRRLLAVVQLLADAPTARSACTTVGLSDAELPSYEQALATLVRTDMLQERPL
jgi:mycofactocin biosynthesis protein MftB